MQVIAPAVSSFEKKLPAYETVDDFVREFEEFIGGIYEKCFLAGESLQRGLNECCAVCLELAGNVAETEEVCEGDVTVEEFPGGGFPRFRR